MPTYNVTSVNLPLSPSTRQVITDIITSSHSRETGAPNYFVQVFFREADLADHFVGGHPNTNRQLFIHGLIRAGRTAEVKRTLIEKVIASVASASVTDPEDIWMYLQDIDADQMAEFGRILPKPGDEMQWRSGLSARKVQQLTGAGVKI